VKGINRRDKKKDHLVLNERIGAFGYEELQTLKVLQRY